MQRRNYDFLREKAPSYMLDKAWYQFHIPNVIRREFSFSLKIYSS